MENYEEAAVDGLRELDEDQLDAVVGGVSVGDVVHVKSWQVQYCSNCGKLLMEYDATITGVRGVLDGHTVYWVTRKCCGWKSSIIDTAIVY